MLEHLLGTPGQSGTPAAPCKPGRDDTGFIMYMQSVVYQSKSLF